MSTFKIERMKPCLECPFTKNGLKGWLGPYENVGELHAAGLSEAGYACHVSHNEMTKQGKHWSESHQCIGALCYASTAFKSFQNPILEEKRLALKDTCPDVLRFIPGLKAHHESLPCSGCDSKNAWLTKKGKALCEECRSKKKGKK